MDEKLNKINESGALQMNRSQLVGKAIDDTIIFNFENVNIINVEGNMSPQAIIMQKLAPDVKAIEETGWIEVSEVHIPKQIKALGMNAMAGATQLKKINLENIEIVGDYALSGAAVNLENTPVVHLDNVKEIGENAFLDAKLTIHLNKDVEIVSQDAFAGAKELHYKGGLEGAPWGAQQWIKD